MSPEEFVIEALPDDVLATIQVRDEWLKRLPPSDLGLEFVVGDVQKWLPGQTVRVAFLGGDVALHKDIVDATAQITSACNLILDFGWDAARNSYRTWTETDTTRTAEIRVSFDQAGFFSLVGTDSIDPGIGSPNAAVGGRPNQRSLNLGGFPIRRPSNWQGVVRHEFLHALAFHHEHQNMRGPCEGAFRWDDDVGYQPTTNASGGYIPDSAGRRPGIYTYLAGAPNFWNKAKVDFNLRTTENPNVVDGPFDRKSVMLYRFPDIFYKSVPSECGPDGDGLSLSPDDIRGLLLLYPRSAAESAMIEDRKNQMLAALRPAAPEMASLESIAEKPSEMHQRISRILMATKAN